MKKLKIWFVGLSLVLILFGRGISEEIYVPSQEAVSVINEVKETLINLPEDLSLSSATIDSLITKCEGVIKTDEKYIDAYIYLSVCYLLKKEFNPGIQAAEKVINLDSVNPDGYFLRGFAFFVSSLQGDTTSFAKAIPDLDKVLFLKPDYKAPEVANKKAEVSDILFWEALSYVELGEHEKAKEILTNLIEKYPESTAAKSAQHELKRLEWTAEQK